MFPEMPNISVWILEEMIHKLKSVYPASETRRKHSIEKKILGFNLGVKNVNILNSQFIPKKGSKGSTL